MVRNVSKVWIHATPNKVWEALTSPVLVKLWQYGSELVTDWVVGHPIRFRTVWNETVFEQWGTVLEFAPAERLSYSLFAPQPGREDRPENYFTMTYRLTAADGGMELEILQDDPRPGAVQEATQGEENPVLAGLKSLAEQ